MDNNWLGHLAAGRRISLGSCWASSEKRILDVFTLRFARHDFERSYMEHHWLHMSYWLWRSVLLGLFYTAISVVFGDEVIMKAFDVRMDHYARTSLVKESPPWMQDMQAQANGNSSQSPGAVDMWQGVKVIELDSQHMIEIPRAGFLAWHFLWCLMFLGILLADRFKHRLCKRCSSTCWVYARAWMAFGVMFCDLVISSFLNPSVARFMVFVYALLIRTQFIQTVVLVFISAMAMLGAGYVGSHEFLNSISVAEFLILNLVCLSAARQTEIHARLSLYRLWFIMFRKDGDHKSETGHEFDRLSEEHLASLLLSLDEIVLAPIPEDDILQEGAGSRVSTEKGPSTYEESEDVEASNGLATPSSWSIRSIGSAQEPSIIPVHRHTVGLRTNFRRLGSADRAGSRSPGGSSIGSRSRSPDKRKDFRARSRSPVTNGSDSENERLSEAGSCGGGSHAESFCSENVAAEDIALPGWISLEGVDRWKRCDNCQWTGDNQWAEVEDPERFTLRGPTYLEDKEKIAASQCAFSVHQARLFRTQAPLLHVAERLPSLSGFLKSHPQHFFLIYNRIIPYNNGTLLNCIVLLARKLPVGQDGVFDALFGKFVNGDDDFRDQRLKHLCRFRKAPSAVTNGIWMLGGEKPVIMGKGYLEQKHFKGPNYLEVDVDISPSRMAKMVVGKVIHHGKTVVMEEMITIEGQSAQELPERPLAAWRWINVDVSKVLIDVSEEAELLPTS